MAGAVVFTNAAFKINGVDISSYIKSVTLSSTMGPGVPLDSAVADAAGKH